MEAGKVRQKSLFKRVFNAPVLIGVVGGACVIYGVSDGIRVMQLFFGLCIVAGSVMLHFVRKKDWDAHWAELDRVRTAHEERMADEAEKKK